VGGRFAQAPGDNVARGAHYGQLRVHLARREGPQERLDPQRAPVQRQADRMVSEEPGRVRPVACRLRVPDGVHDLSVLAEPRGRSPVQGRHFPRKRPAELQPQEVGEQHQRCLSAASWRWDDRHLPRRRSIKGGEETGPVD
jgi:hypothetical protein